MSMMNDTCLTWLLDREKELEDQQCIRRVQEAPAPSDMVPMDDVSDPVRYTANGEEDHVYYAKKGWRWVECVGAKGFVMAWEHFKPFRFPTATKLSGASAEDVLDVHAQLEKALLKNKDLSNLNKYVKSTSGMWKTASKEAFKNSLLWFCKENGSPQEGSIGPLIQASVKILVDNDRGSGFVIELPDLDAALQEFLSRPVLQHAPGAAQEPFHPPPQVIGSNGVPRVALAQGITILQDRLPDLESLGEPSYQAFCELLASYESLISKLQLEAKLIEKRVDDDWKRRNETSLRSSGKLLQDQCFKVEIPNVPKQEYRYHAEPADAVVKTSRTKKDIVEVDAKKKRSKKNQKKNSNKQD